MAHAKDRLEFLERRVGMFSDMGAKFFGVELAPAPPALFRRQHARLRGGQVAIDAAAAHAEPDGRLRLPPAFTDEIHHPLPQIKCIGFHSTQPATLCANVNMKYYITA